MMRTGIRSGSRSSLFKSVVAVHDLFGSSAVRESDVCANQLGAQQQMRRSRRAHSRKQQTLEARQPHATDGRANPMQIGHEDSRHGMPIGQPPIAFGPGMFLLCRRPGPSSYVEDEIRPHPSLNWRANVRGSSLGQVRRCPRCCLHRLALESTYVVPPISELPIERFLSASSSIVEPRIWRSRLHVWSYLTPREVEVKDASTAAVLFTVRSRSSRQSVPTPGDHSRFRDVVYSGGAQSRDSCRN